MNKLVAVLALLFATPVVADTKAPPPAAEKSRAQTEGRLVPTMKDQKLIGYKVYAIKTGGRFDQPQGPYQNGDVILKVDGIDVTTDEGAVALFDRVIEGKQDAVVIVLRSGVGETKLESRAKR